VTTELADTRSSRQIRVRDASAGDRAFVLETAKRLAAFDPPAWRTREEIWEGEARTLRQWFETPDIGTLLVAVANDTPVGFIFLERSRDYFTQEEHGHVGILAVAAEAEGTGAGRALLEAGEAWARDYGYERITLNVFEGNARARAVYERLGYAPETIRYSKTLVKSQLPNPKSQTDGTSTRTPN
jgi:RimJ/RimL family protein N-acetyltransferase